VDINEDALRAMIRESIRRHLGEAPAPAESHAHVEYVPATFLTHASHHRYTLEGSGGPCIIEPAVTCNHCGFCQSHGH
jgi:hypothetical protein